MAKPETKVYGAADPALAYTVSGFQFTDPATGVLSGSLSRAPGEAVADGPYAISQGSLAASSNYMISLTGNFLSITQATPKVTVSNPGGTYTGSAFAASALVMGLTGAAATSLEGVPLSLTYYVGSGTSGTSLGSMAPVVPATYTAVARFAGSADYSPMQSAVTFKINAGTPMIALAPSTASAVYGQPITFVATVDGPVTPSGTVTFLDGSTVLATVALNGSSTAMLTTAAMGVGSHSITATYSGDVGLAASQSGPASESVSQAATTIVLVPHPVLKKKKVKSEVLTAQIEPRSPGGGVPTGTATFELLTKKKKHKIKTKILGIAVVDGAGTGTLTFKPKRVLRKAITIVYSGDGNFLASTLTAPS